MFGKENSNVIKITPIEIRNKEDARKFMASLGVAKEGINILSPKSVHSAFKIEGIKSWEANIIKQHMLSLGSDAAIERNALMKNIKTTAFIFGNLSQLKKLSQKLKNQPFSLGAISKDIAFYLRNLEKKEFTLHARNKVLRIKKPVVCGIVNITDDSFSGDGLIGQAKRRGVKLQDLALRQTESMIANGAKMIDIGGESSRPFSRQVKPKEEIKRIVPVLKAIRKRFKKIIISVDTYKYEVARASTDEGVDIINDITALRADYRIASLIKKYRLGCVLMHMKGTPQTMQINPKYKNVVEEEIDFFKARLEFCDQNAISRDRIIIDPGIGFGKNLKDNTRIINELYKFKIFGLPILLGLSRKSFIGKMLNIEVGQRLIGTIAASIISLTKGSNILRVHDVKETTQAIRMVSGIINN